MSASQIEPDAPSERVGPAALLLPLLVLGCWVFWVRDGSSAPGGERAAPPSAAEQQTQGWLGARDLSDGARLEARLVSLHGEELRQDFDRSVLAERLSLDRDLVVSGEPWLLELVHSSGPDGGATSLPLGSLCLLSNGRQIMPLVRMAPAPAPGGLVDPMVSLLALPSDLPPDSRLNAVLWGERPGPSAILTLGEHEVPMGAETLAAGSISRILAHLDRSSER